MAASGGGGRIEVDPAALEQLAHKVLAEVQEGKASAGEATTKAQLATGNGKLDASLGGFARAWGQLVTEEISQDGERRARGIDTAATNYRQTDRTAMPKVTGTGEDGTP